MSVNRLTLIGRVGDNPNTHNFNEQDSVTKVSLATDDSYKNKEGQKVEVTDWHNLIFRGGLAKVVEKYVKKGDLLYISGKVKTRSYEKDGKKMYVTEVICNEMKMLGGVKKDDSGLPQSDIQPKADNSNTGDGDLPF